MSCEDETWCQGLPWIVPHVDASGLQYMVFDLAKLAHWYVMHIPRDVLVSGFWCDGQWHALHNTVVCLAQLVQAMQQSVGGEITWDPHMTLRPSCAHPVTIELPAAAKKLLDLPQTRHEVCATAPLSLLRPNLDVDVYREPSRYLPPLATSQLHSAAMDSAIMQDHTHDACEQHEAGVKMRRLNHGGDSESDEKLKKELEREVNNIRRLMGHS